MPPSLPVKDVFHALYWPHRMLAEPAPDGTVRTCYQWKCGCRAYMIDHESCWPLWCEEHGEPASAVG